MKGLIFFILLALMPIIWSIISGITNSIRQKNHEEEIIKNIGPSLEKGLSELEASAADLNIISNKIEELKKKVEKNRITIKSESGEVINICPNCGDTLTVKTVNWHGRILGCPNYPKCHYLKKVRDIKVGIFRNLHFQD